MALTPEQIKAVNDALDAQTLATNNAATSWADFETTTDKVATGRTKINALFQDASNYLKTFGTAIVDNGVSLGKMNSNLSNTVTILSNLKAFTKNEDIFGGLSNAASNFGTLDAGIKSVQANMGQFGTVIPDVLKKIAGAFGENAVSGQKMEQEFINMMAAGGNLNQIFDKQGGLTGNLAAQTATYATSLKAVGDASGMTLKEVAAYASQLNKIPGILTENVDTQSRAIGITTAMNAAMKVLSGSGQDFNTMLKDMNLAYENLGNAQGQVEDTGAKGLKLFSTMVQVSKDLNLRFSDTEGFLTQVANQFKLVGDNTEGATKVLGRFMDALRSTGLTSKASLEVIQGMVKGIGDMTLAQRAFLSARSGGPGGLQGAVQIEQLLRQGKVDEVMRMAEQNLRQQFGGRIVTQAQAATNQQDAAQFVRQRALLQSGSFGDLVGRGPGADDRATRLLEALAKGDRGEAVKVGQAALKTTVDQGNNLQAATNTILTQVASNTQLIAISAQLTALNTTRQLLNSGTLERSGISRTQLGRMEAAGQDLTTGRQFVGQDNLGSALDKMLKPAAEQFVQLPLLAKEAMGKAQEQGAKVIGAGRDLAKDVYGAVQHEKEIQATEQKIPHPGVPSQLTPPNRSLLVQHAMPNPQMTAPRHTVQAAMERQTAASGNEQQTVKVMVEMGPRAKQMGMTATVQNSPTANPIAQGNRQAGAGDPSSPAILPPSKPAYDPHNPGY